MLAHEIYTIASKDKFLFVHNLNCMPKKNYTLVSVSRKIRDEEEKDGVIVMEDTEFPKVRRTTLAKFMDEFEKTDIDMKALSVNNATIVTVDFKNLEREINQKCWKKLQSK